MDSVKTFRSKGKILLTAEYTVLDGALALAVPTQQGQSLNVHFSNQKNNRITWLAYKNNGELWFTCILDVIKNQIVSTNKPELAATLLQIFHEVHELGSPIFNEDFGYECETQLEFPEDWGLGSSSTLINNIAKWSKVNPYHLLSKTFGGSGYDIACADAETPITYQLMNGEPLVKDAFISSSISDNLIFVHLNKKQNSREGIQQYRKKEKSQDLINTITQITKAVNKPKCTFKKFSELMVLHEQSISEFLGIPTVKEEIFSDYPGFIKSLGAWGGDFIMAENTENSQQYFNQKGFKTTKRYDEFLI